MTKSKALSKLKWPRRLAATASALWFGMQLFLFLSATASVQAQTLTVLYAFRGHGDGAKPSVGLVRDSIGNLYGTTFFGGSFREGAIFEVDAHGKETVLHSFWGGDGWYLTGALIRDHTGALYGNASAGGMPEGGTCTEHGCGAVFKVDREGRETTVYAFPRIADGWSPDGNLARDESGNLYGVTAGGGDTGAGCGPSGCGIVFEVDTKGKKSTLYAFTNSPDGEEPEGGLIRDQSGNLYGTTRYGGTSNCGGWGCGTVFKVDAKGNETVLYSFTGAADGMWPYGPLAIDNSGNLYGPSSFPNGSDYNLIFKLDTTGKFTILHTFKGGTDGRWPEGGLLLDKLGNLLGTTGDGGSTGCGGDGCGTIFKLDAHGTKTLLYSFTGGQDGVGPNGGLIMDSSGNLYGTTYVGGDSSCGQGTGCGVVFKLTP